MRTSNDAGSTTSPPSSRLPPVDILILPFINPFVAPVDILISPTLPSCDAPTCNASDPVLPSTVSPLLNCISPEDCEATPLIIFTLPEAAPLPDEISTLPLVNKLLPPDVIETIPPVAPTLIPLAIRTSPPFEASLTPIELPAKILMFPPWLELESPAVI